MDRKALKFNQNMMFQKALIAWKLQLPELKQKNTLIRLVKNEHAIKMAAKCIEGLKTYLLYRNQKKRTDHFMGISVR